MKKAILTVFCSMFVVMLSIFMPVHAEENGASQENIIENGEGSSDGELDGKEEESDKEDETGDGESGDDEESGNDKESGNDEEIEEKKLISDLKNLKITLSKGTSYTYTGKAIVPEVTSVSFTDKDGNQLVSSGVKVEKYINNTKIGTADAVISIEGYEGTVTVKGVFKIVFGKVTSLKTTPTAYNKIKLSWSKVAGADGYVIYRSTKSTSGFKAIKTIDKGSTTSYTNTSLKMGTTYYYKIRAYRLVNDKRSYSAYTNVVRQKAQVATAKITSAKRASYNSITIKWNKVSGASGYGIYRSTSEKGTYTRIGTAKGGSKVTYTDKKRSCGVTYYYKVAAYRTSGKKNYYGSKSACVSAYTTPDKVSFTSSTMSGNTQADLFWKKSSGASGYTIYRSTNSSSGYKAVKNIAKASTLKWSDKGLDEEQVYYYKVRPYVLRNDKKIYGSYSSAFKKELYSKKMASIQKYTYVQYRSGGASPSGWDCSGFTKWAMKYLYGIDIPKYSGSQATGGKSVSKTNKSKWEPGDILVYSSGGRVNHVALYIGNNKIMHALNTKYDTVIHDVDYYEKWDKKNNLKCVRRYH